MADYSHRQRRRQTNAKPWAWNWATRQPELYAGQVPTAIADVLLPDRAPGRRRAAPRAYQLTELQGGGLLYLETGVPVTVETSILPDVARGRRRAAPNAYRLERYYPAANESAPAAPPPGRVLFSDQQAAQERAFYPSRRARRRKFSAGAGSAPDIAPLSHRVLLPQRAPGRKTGLAAYDLEPYSFTHLGAPLTPIERQTRLFPLRAPGPRRAAASAYTINGVTVELYGGQVPTTSADSTLPERAPGPRRNPDAYRLRAFQVDVSEEPEEQHERRLLPDRTPRTLRASAACYALDQHQVDPVGTEDELLANRQAIHEFARGARRAQADAYWLPSVTVDLIAASDLGMPHGISMLPDHQIIQDRAQYPQRRQRRRVLPGRSEPSAALPDFSELFAARTLLPDRAPGPARADRTAYALVANLADLYAPPAPTEFEELLASRTLVPQRAPGARRSGADAYDLLVNRVDLYAPTPVIESDELFAARQILPDRVYFARRRFRRKFYPGAPQATQSAEGQSLLPERGRIKRRADASAYQIQSFSVDAFGALAPQEIVHILLPERVYGRPRAASDAYALAPSLVELYATQTPVEVTRTLVPQRAPGRPRAGRSAYALQNNDPEFFAPPFVAPPTSNTRLLLGVGL